MIAAFFLARSREQADRIENVFLLSRPSNTRIQSFLNQQETASFSYPGVGVSQGCHAPAGYVVDHNRVRLGIGNEVWDRGKQAIQQWKMFDMPWVQLCWPNAPVELKSTVGIAIRHYGFWSLNAARIVYCIAEDTRFGFAYGTLHEHGECGEERFLVERRPDEDAVWYDLFAFSRPHAALAKIGRPLARSLQKKFARGSMNAMVRATATPIPAAPPIARR